MHLFITFTYIAFGCRINSPRVSIAYASGQLFCLHFSSPFPSSFFFLSVNSPFPSPGLHGASISFYSIMISLPPFLPSLFSALSPYLLFLPNSSLSLFFLTSVSSFRYFFLSSIFFVLLSLSFKSFFFFLSSTFCYLDLLFLFSFTLS